MALPVNGSTHLIPAYYSFYRPPKDERLSWPSWLTCSGWLTHISGHPSAAGRAQDRESSPARDRRSTTVPMEMASRKIQTYQNKAKILYTIYFVFDLYVNANSLKQNIIVLKEIRSS